MIINPTGMAGSHVAPSRFDNGIPWNRLVGRMIVNRTVGVEC